MNTIAQDLKAEMKKLDEGIAWANGLAERHPASADLCREYAAQLEKRRKQVVAQLQRENARLVKPQPADVKAAPGSPISV